DITLVSRTIARRGVDRVAQETEPLGKPGVLEWHAELLRPELGQLVLDTCFVLVREGHVVRVGAHAQRLACRTELRIRSERDQQQAEETAGAGHLQSSIRRCGRTAGNAPSERALR